MTPELVMDIAKQAMQLAVVLMALLLLPGLFVGLLVSLFQAATQINEMTLSFIPKLLVTVAVLVFGGPLMLRLVIGYTQSLFESIPGLLGG
ncbi:MAG: flagellar biosynthesis protein FliQ [Chromatiales bacterium]